MRREFNVVIERDSDGYYVASVPELRGCHTQARSLDKLLSRVKEAIELCLEVSDSGPATAEFVGVQRVAVEVLANSGASTGRQVIKALQRAGFSLIRTKGSHHFMRHSDGRATVVPVHAGETLRVGLLSQILKDAEIERADFDGLL